MPTNESDLLFVPDVNCRAVRAYGACVRLTSLSESASVLTFVEKFGFKVDDDSGVIKFSSPKSWFDFGEELRDNDGVDEVCEIAHGHEAERVAPEPLRGQTERG